MRRLHVLGLAMAALATTTVLVTPSGAAHADIPDQYIYVDNSGLNRPCSDTGSGTTNEPLCTLAAGVAAARPGTYVAIYGTHDEHLVVTKSGTPDKPITFGSGGGELAGGRAGITIDGQHDIRITALHVSSYSGPAISISNSTRVTLNYPQLYAGHEPAVRLTAVTDSVLKKVRVPGGDGTAISLDAATTGVTVTAAEIYKTGTQGDVGVLVSGSRNTVIGNTVKAESAGIRIAAGATGNVVASNIVTAPSHSAGIDNAGATGTSITNNTVSSSCAAGIRVSGASTGVTVQNNIVTASGACHGPGIAGLGVYDTAVSDTTVDYNTVRAPDGTDPYAWSTAVGSLAAFRTVSGQGTHDLDAPGRAVNVDSANSAAPGYVAVDFQGYGRQDDPGVANSGAGLVGYADRGAYEMVTAPTARITLSASEDGRTITADASQSTPGWAPIASYSFYFEGTTVTQAGPVASHTFESRRENVSVPVTVTDSSGVQARETGTIQPGDGYTPVGPVRVLDTRSAIGAPRTVPLAPGERLVLPVADRNGLPATGVTSVTMNVTVTEPTTAGVLAVRPYDAWSATPTSNLNWTPGLTVANLAVVGVHDGKVEFSNNSSGTVHVVADLVGYHRAAKASRFVPQAPVRVLDTRERIGVGTTTPVAPLGTVTLQVTDRAGVPATGVTAVTLNVTATASTAAGFVTAYPNGQPVPNASTLNWGPGLTVPNLVVVPVINGKVDFRNSSSGTVHLIADLVGYHTTGAGDAFHSSSPRRVLDTRERIGTAGTTPVPPNSEVTLNLWDLTQQTGPLTGVVLNVTVTGPTTNGFLTVYPGYSGPRPNASNLNWRPGQTVPNLVVVPVVDGHVRFHNSSSGTVHIIADVYGYYTG